MAYDGGKEEADIVDGYRRGEMKRTFENGTELIYVPPCSIKMNKGGEAVIYISNRRAKPACALLNVPV